MDHKHLLNIVATTLHESEIKEWLTNKDNEYLYKDIKHKIQCYEDSKQFFIDLELYEKASIVQKEINILKNDNKT